MEILPCPHCNAGTKCLARIVTRDGYKWLFLQRYASCECELTAMDRARLVEQAEHEEVRAS